jgi:peptide/nickel transport system ATP-binding protein/oligopeptide transport system ATP-binding protein
MFGTDPTTDADRTILEVRDLHTYFRTADGIVRAVDGVSFAITAGTSVGIVGESGSGKSVTSLSIMRLVELPGWIAGGEIVFQGKDLLTLSEREMQRIRGDDITMVFQEPMTALDPVYTVGHQVAEVLRLHRKLSRKAATRRAIELFKTVGIPDAERRIDEYPHNLSGGMRQRVVIAMALANEPDLLILDEPTTALDVTIQAQILELVKRLRQEFNTTVLLITHDIGVIAEVSDEVIVMYGGKIMEHGAALQIIQEPKHPYTQGLLASIPSVALKSERLTVIAGTVPNPLRMPPGCPFAPRCPHVMEVCGTMPELKTLEGGRDVACWLY